MPLEHYSEGSQPKSVLDTGSSIATVGEDSLGHGNLRRWIERLELTDTCQSIRTRRAGSGRRWHTYAGPLSLRRTERLLLFIHLDNDPIGSRPSERFRRVHLFRLGWGRHE